MRGHRSVILFKASCKLIVVESIVEAEETMQARFG